MGIDFEVRKFKDAIFENVDGSKGVKFVPLKGDIPEKSILLSPGHVGILDLDELVSVLSCKPHEHGGQFSLSIPDCATEFAIASGGSLLAGAGIYFSYKNWNEAEEYMTKLRDTLKIVKDEFKEKSLDERLNIAKGNEKIRLLNIKAYISSLENFFEEKDFQRFYGGKIPFVGCSAMLGGIFLPFLSGPALVLVTTCLWRHSIKYLWSWNKLRKEVSLYEGIPADKEGLKIFKERQESKSKFFKYSALSWLVYGSGTACLGVISMAALLGSTLPVAPVLLPVGCLLLVKGLIATLYLNSFHAFKYIPKTGNKVQRPMLGKQNDILKKISLYEENLGAIEKFENENKKSFTVSEWLKTKMRYFAAYATAVITLGVPEEWIHRWMKRIERDDIVLSEMASKKENISRNRLILFNEILDSEIKYLKKVKRSKSFDKNFKKGLLNTSKRVTSERFRGRIRDAEKEKKQLKARIVNLRENYSVDDEFKVLCEFLDRGGLIDKIFAKVHKDVIKDSSFDGYFCEGVRESLDRFKHISEELKEKEYKNYIFAHEKFKEDLASDDEERKNVANKFMKKFLLKVDYAITHDLKNDFDYRKGELCDHLEDLFRKG